MKSFGRKSSSFGKLARRSTSHSSWRAARPPPLFLPRDAGEDRGGGLNGLNGLSVLNSVSPSGSPQLKTKAVREIVARWAAGLIRHPRAGARETQ